MRVNDAAPTISGPGWTTVATGVLADLHGVYGNDLDGHRIADHPDFLTRIRTAAVGIKIEPEWKLTGRPLDRD